MTESITKEQLIQRLNEIATSGWFVSERGRNDGAVGNTLEDLLGIEENNLPIPNAAEWELKAQRSTSNSLLTLCHMEPSPRALSLVSRMLLPKYGWPHQGAGSTYGAHERSFRATLVGGGRTDRGFSVQVDEQNQRLVISFDASQVDGRHALWLAEVQSAIGLGELNPQPYWGYRDLEHKMGTKLTNCFLVTAKSKRIDGIEHFWFNEAWMLSGFEFGLFVEALSRGDAYIDFDARSGHNHGTKFRIKKHAMRSLYANEQLLFRLTEEPPTENSQLRFNKPEN